MRTFAILLTALIAGTSFAAPSGSSIIKDAELEEYLRPVQERAKLVQERKMTLKEVLDYCKARVTQVSGARNKAKAEFAYGYALQAADQRAASRKAYERALAHHAAFPAPHVSLAALAELSKNLRRAHKHLNKALSIDPDYLHAIVQKARIYDRQGKHDRALRLFKRSLDIEYTGEALIGMARIYVMKFHLEIDEKQKDVWAKKAIGAARAYIFNFNESPRAHLFLAKVYKDLGMLPKSVEKLESVHRDTALVQGARDDALKMLAQLYMQTFDLPNLEKTLDRLVKQESLRPEERGVLKTRLEDLRKMGKTAPAVWQINTLLEVVKNDGIPTDARVRAMRSLLELYSQDALLGNEHLRDLADKILRRIMRSLIKSPPEMTIEVLKWLRKDVRDKELIRILVHFVYPAREPEVRKEGVRAVAACGEVVALPTLLYCLEDLEGNIMRELDQLLSRQFNRRAAVRSDGVSAYTPEQMQQCRKTWLAFARSDDAAPKLEQAFAGLTKIVGKDPSQARTQRSAPLVDHTISAFLLDDAMPWRTWNAAYQFLQVYWGRDFRAPGKRNTPVTESERGAIVKELSAFWGKAGSGAAKPKAPAPGK